ncbi:MAG: DJ-1/PfpI family protein [Anaerolineae bacterium]|nr:DJ-1/PfpI family protein [Anaerolineae bacterium]
MLGGDTFFVFDLFKIMAKARYTHTILLLADGFEEEAILVATLLREAGLRVTIVGLRSSQVTGLHGIIIKPDISLDRLLEMTMPISALIVPEGGGHIERLRSDPRVNILLRERLDCDGLVVGLGDRVDKFLRDYVGDAVKYVSLDKWKTWANSVVQQIAAQLLERGRS